MRPACQCCYLPENIPTKESRTSAKVCAFLVERIVRCITKDKNTGPPSRRMPAPALAAGRQSRPKTPTAPRQHLTGPKIYLSATWASAPRTRAKTGGGRGRPIRSQWRRAGARAVLGAPAGGSWRPSTPRGGDPGPGLPAPPPAGPRLARAPQPPAGPALAAPDSGLACSRSCCPAWRSMSSPRTAANAQSGRMHSTRRLAKPGASAAFT